MEQNTLMGMKTLILLKILGTNDITCDLGYISNLFTVVYWILNNPLWGWKYWTRLYWTLAFPGWNTMLFSQKLTP
jgi:hypothetical protein